MAKGQPQGIGAITVWMIVFVALWLTSTVFLVILYTGQEELRSQNETLRAENDRLITTQERTALPLVSDAKPGGPTVVGLLETARKRTAELATGTGADDPETVRTKRDQLLSSVASEGLVPNPKEFKGASLHGGLTMLYEAFKAEHALRTAAEERANTLDSKVADLVRQNGEQKDDLDKRAAHMAEQLKEAEAGRVQSAKERDAAVAKLEQNFEDAIKEHVAALTQERQRRAALERDKNELQKRFAAQQEKVGEALLGGGELAAARQADGHVLTAVPGDEVVYIDLGREHRLLLGLRFGVYSADTGIPADGKSKAQLEVVSIGQTSAECKVLRLAPDQVIMEGDLIANPVYDPKRALTFMVAGEFDLDRDGQLDADGKASVESIVTTWGGATTEELSALTDFLVLGAPPRRPRPAAETTGEQAERQQAAQARWDAYQQLLESAKNLAVPVLSQESFLAFLGRQDERVSRR
ncbi:MAG: hypothetical protein HY763_03220 [Planctomycetes bacterium]|nr:hypothetical protein [Planctomycetota bacterium]